MSTVQLLESKTLIHRSEVSADSVGSLSPTEECILLGLELAGAATYKDIWLELQFPPRQINAALAKLFKLKLIVGIDQQD